MQLAVLKYKQKAVKRKKRENGEGPFSRRKRKGGSRLLKKEGDGLVKFDWLFQPLCDYHSTVKVKRR